MADIKLMPKVPAANSLLQVAELGIGKVGSEMLLSRVTGNSTVKSGLFKLGAGAVGYTIGRGILGKHGEMLAGGVIVDGVEDIILGIWKGKMGTDNGAAVTKNWYD